MEASLVYIGSSRSAKAEEQGPVSKQNKLHVIENKTNNEPPCLWKGEKV